MTEKLAILSTPMIDFAGSVTQFRITEYKIIYLGWVQYKSQQWQGWIGQSNDAQNEL